MEILVIVGRIVVFEVNALFTESYDLHYHAYIVKPLTHNFSIPLNQVHSFHPLTFNTSILLFQNNYHVVNLIHFSYKTF